MLRDYESGVSSTPVLFVGKEVEKTKHFDKQTLFVVGLNHHVQEISNIATLNQCPHVYLAANHSYPGAWSEQEWISAIVRLRLNLDVTLEVEHKHLTDTLVSASKVFDFVLMVGCPIPNIHDNIVIKADDIDFKATNQGVWTMNPTVDLNVHFTPWSAYTNDKVIE